MKFVIIGGDAAGMSAASRAKRIRPDMDVTVLEQTTDVSYSACGMPYNIADPGRSIEDLVVRRAQVFRDKQGINLLTGHRVEQINPVARRIKGITASGEVFELPYGRLLIATGAAALMPVIAGVEQPGVMALKNLEQGRLIKAFIDSEPVKKTVIIGMGYIALEMCEALRARGIEVTMVKPRVGLLPWMDPELSAVVRTELEKNGVEIFDGHGVEEIAARPGGLQVICPQMTLEADMVLVAIGVRPNSEMAARAGLELGPGKTIAVNQRLMSSDEHIFAAGDCADAFHVVTGGRVWVPLALRANRAGWAVADNVCGKSVRLAGIAGTAVFKVFDMQVARTGLSTSEAEAAGFDPVQVVVKTRSRAHAHPGADAIRVQMVGDRSSGRLLGVFMVGREGVAHRINAPAVALHARMTVAEFGQSDLAYAPPFGPVWDPMLIAASQLLKKL